MDDKTLLERAARAAGYIRMEYRDEVPYVSVNWNGEGFVAWNPLQDDGDEARLEAAVNIDIEWHPIGVVASINGGARFREPYSDHNGDKQKARRYAGVRAAAAIGIAHEAQ